MYKRKSKRTRRVLKILRIKKIQETPEKFNNSKYPNHLKTEKPDKSKISG